MTGHTPWSEIKHKADEPEPFVLLQEIYRDDPWKLLVGCILLNLTNRKQVDRVVDSLFARYVGPAEMALANETVVATLLSPIGLQNRKAATLIRMSREFMEEKRRSNRGTLDESQVSKLPGVGPYALDSYRFFVLGDTSRFESNDKELAAWLRTQT